MRKVAEIEVNAHFSNEQKMAAAQYCNMAHSTLYVGTLEAIVATANLLNSLGRYVSSFKTHSTIVSHTCLQGQSSCLSVFNHEIFSLQLFF